MRDIYHELLRHPVDFESFTDESLEEAGDLYAGGFSAITRALTLIGNLVLEAPESEGYADEDAMRDLRMVGEALRYLPRMALAMRQNSDTVEYVIRQRRGKQ